MNKYAVIVISVHVFRYFHATKPTKLYIINDGMNELTMTERYT